VDTVILAAGRNQRLQHIVPPYHKPFIVIDGKSVLGRAVDWPSRVYGHINRVIVVCAPENSLQAAHVVSGRAMLVVQPEARGPGDALWHGLQLVRTPQVLVLMGDNVTTDEDLDKFYSSKVWTPVDPPKIGVQCMAGATRARSFTVWNRSHRRWEEKVPITDEHLETVVVSPDGTASQQVTCWFGPLVLNTETALEVLDVARVRPDGTVRPELLIGPILSDLAPDAEQVHVSTYDVDTEVLR